MSDWRYITGVKTDGRRVTMAATPDGPDVYPLDPAVLAAFDAIAEVPPNAIKVKIGEKAQPAIDAAKPGQVVLLQRGGKWGGRIKPKSGVSIGAYGEGDAPIVAGIHFATPGVTNVTIEDIEVRPTNAAKMYGIEAHQPSLSKLTFRRVKVSGFEDNASFHHPQLDHAPAAEWLADILFEKCHLLDAKDTDQPEQYRGQGLFAYNVNGLKIRECLIDNNGDPVKANMYRHGLYIGAKTMNVWVEKCIITRNASYGAQIRSGGGVMTECFFYDNAICAMLNGPSGTLTECVGVRGHWQKMPGGLMAGRNGFDLHIGSGRIANNLLLGPKDPKIPAGYVQHPKGFSVGPRKDNGQGWEWTKPCNPGLAGNYERETTIAAEQEIQAARQTFDIEPIRQALFAKARAA